MQPGERQGRSVRSTLLLILPLAGVVGLVCGGLYWLSPRDRSPVPDRLIRRTLPAAAQSSPTLTHDLPPTWTPVRPDAVIPAPTPLSGRQPTLADFWDGRARFRVDVPVTGLPMGESDTIVMPNGEFWSYVHASDRSAGVRDRCGNPVGFPGCVVIYRSSDGGRTFRYDEPPVCLFECRQCPCDSENDHIDQQQYPRLQHERGIYHLVYEYRARLMLRRSVDGLAWSAPEEVPFTGIWQADLRGCPAAEVIGVHPFVPHEYDCLVGGPPGLYIERGWLYVFAAFGQNPAGLGCVVGPADGPALQLRRCSYNPLFRGAPDYGPLEVTGRAANAHFDFRTISAAEVLRIGSRYYALYEGIRGPAAGDPGDSQFGLGLARSRSGHIDGPWETYSGNPILQDLPGNIGLGHADLLVVDGRTWLYTSLDGATRSRLILEWQ